MSAGPFCSPHDLQIHDSQDDTLNINLTDVRAYAWGATFICVFVACALTVQLVYKHLTNFHYPPHQKHIVRILVMVPVYAIDSWLSFRLYWLSVYFDLFRDCYEAFVINEFYSLLIEYTGGYKQSKEVFSEKPPFNLMAPLCCINISPRRGLLRTCRRLTLQYVVLRPVLSVVALILHAYGRYCPGELTYYNRGYVWITLVMLISVTFSMYALVLFYVIAKAKLAEYNPVPKFLSIKFIIAMAFWQSVMVAGLIRLKVLQATSYWSTDNMSTGVQNFLICIEMLIVAIWHVSAFTYKEYASAGPEPTPIWKGFLVCFNLFDIAKDVWRSFLFVVIRKEKKNKHKRFNDEDGMSNTSSLAYSTEMTIPAYAQPLSNNNNTAILTTNNDNTISINDDNESSTYIPPSPKLSSSPSPNRASSPSPNRASSPGPNSNPLNSRFSITNNNTIYRSSSANQPYDFSGTNSSNNSQL